MAKTLNRALQWFEVDMGTHHGGLGKGNVIQSEGPVTFKKLDIRGENNTVKVHKNANLSGLHLLLECNDGSIEIGDCKFQGMIRLGEKCKIKIGNKVTMTGSLYISSAEHNTVAVGDGCMFAAGVEIRSDDAHPIFDITTEKRINMPQDVILKEHVWIGGQVKILGGTRIGEGSVIGIGSIVKGEIPNNVIAAGIMAKVVRTNIAWERPHLNMEKPFYKPDASYIKKGKYWSSTRFEETSDEIIRNLHKKSVMTLSKNRRISADYQLLLLSDAIKYGNSTLSTKDVRDLYVSNRKSMSLLERGITKLRRLLLEKIGFRYFY